MSIESSEDQRRDRKAEAEKPSVTMPGTVEKIIPAVSPNESDKAQIAVNGAEELYREIRVPNVLQDQSGNEVALKKGAGVDITIEADQSATTPKEPSKGSGSAQAVPPDDRRSLRRTVISQNDSFLRIGDQKSLLVVFTVDNG